MNLIFLFGFPADYQTFGLSDYRTIEHSDYWTIGKSPFIQYYINSNHTRSVVSRVWQVGHVPWVPLEGGATERF